MTEETLKCIIEITSKLDSDEKEVINTKIKGTVSPAMVIALLQDATTKLSSMWDLKKHRKNQKRNKF